MHEDFQCECQACGMPFTVREYSPNALGDRDRWPLECPHCGEITVEKSAGYLEILSNEK